MKNKYLLVITLVFLSLNLQASSSYRDMKHGNYISKSHLYYIFNKVKKTSSVSQKALAKTFDYYTKNRYKKHLSPNFIAIADYTKLATEKRLFIINLHTGEVHRHLVAHGVNSGAKGGRVWRTSNQIGSNQTPIGFFKVGHKEGMTYKKRDNYLAIEGLGWKNRNAKKREIILHTASYVQRAGRSKGCFAIMPEDRWQVFSRLKRALLFSYAGH